MSQEDSNNGVIEAVPPKWDSIRTIVLLSGGIDSSLCLSMIRGDPFEPVGALFVDYAQRSLRRESEAAEAISRHFGVPLRRIRLVGGPPIRAGVISARNALLVMTALFSGPPSLRMIVLGIHAGTAFPDCGPAFVQAMTATLDLYCHGAVVLSAPLIDLFKSEICDLAIERNLPIGLTHSCDSSDTPCHKCLSCQDREAILARA